LVVAACIASRSYF